MNHAEFRRRAYSTYFSSHYGGVRSNIPSIPTFERIAKGLQANFGRYVGLLPPGARVLDVGCGVGHFLYYLAKRGFQTEGVDVSAEQLAQGREFLPDGVQLHCADANEFLAERPNTYDAIVCTDTLEHLRNYEALEMADLMHGALRPGGLLIFRVPNAACPSGAALLYVDLTHERSFTEKSAAQLLRIAGFEVVGISNWDFPILTPMHVIPWLLRHVQWFLYKLVVLVHDYYFPPRVVSRLLVACGRKKNQES